MSMQYFLWIYLFATQLSFWYNYSNYYNNFKVKNIKMIVTYSVVIAMYV